ncbi:MAG: cytochrome P450 [Nitriliruptorales bacterium]|nr:cytochrome P450 [Nitriliruptorales bacterium]
MSTRYDDLAPAVPFDPYAPAFLDDPYPVYAELRERTPVFYDDDWGLVFFTRWEDVNGILRDRRFGRDVHHELDVKQDVDPDLYRRIYPPEYPRWVETIRGSFIDLEPPEHTRLRGLVNKAFTRRASESYRGAIRATADRALDRVVDERTVDAIATYGVPIPVAMITDLLGIPEGDDRQQLLDWSHAIVRLFDRDVTPEEGEAAEQAVIEFTEYVRGLLDLRRREPSDDLITAMLEVEEGGEKLSEQDIVNTTILALNAGHEATVHAIGNGLLSLSQDRDAFSTLRRDPEGVKRTAADELLRYDAPLQMFERWVLDDLEWNGVDLEKGTKVGLLFGSANRDPDAIDEPDRLDLTRERCPHLSFGAGIHYCVGAPLASVELEEAFAAFADRVASFELTTDELDRIPSLVFRGVRKLPITVEPA